MYQPPPLPVAETTINNKDIHKLMVYGTTMPFGIVLVVQNVYGFKFI